MTLSPQTTRIRLALDRKDAHHRVTRITALLAAVGLAMAVAMAVFGLPPISLSGPLHDLGLICPLCGGTRSARLTAQGDLAGAWDYNPLGILAVVGAAVAILRPAVGWITGRWINLYGHLSPRQKHLAIAAAVILLVVLEIRQLQRSDLLTSRA